MTSRTPDPFERTVTPQVLAVFKIPDGCAGGETRVRLDRRARLHADLPEGVTARLQGVVVSSERPAGGG